VALLDQARDMKERGLDVISFCAGEPDFDTPAHITAAGIEALNNGLTQYVSSRGIPELRRSVAAKLLRDNRVTVDPDTGVIVTAGSKMAIFISLVGLVAPGDEVLYFEPAWPSFEQMIRLATAEPVAVPLDGGNGFHIDEGALETRITPRTRAIILNTPHNPTGCILSADDLAIVERLANRHDLFVISDEIYDRIVFDAEHISPATLPLLAERTLTVNGFSKTHAMMGWRLGFVAGPEPLISRILLVQQHTVTCAASFVQHAGVVALNGPQEPIADMVRAYRRRRDVIVAALEGIPGVSCDTPAGTFYAFPRIEGLSSSGDLAEALLRDALIATTPGSAFGEPGEGHLRFSFACSTKDIEVGMNRFAEFLRNGR
jgi:aspartate aminotransferase